MIGEQEPSTSIRTLDLSGLPLTVSWSQSEPVPAIPDLSLAVCHIRGDHVPLCMPSLAEPGVGVHLDGCMWVEGELVQPFSRQQYACGASVLVPANVTSHWLFHGEGTNLNFFLSSWLLPSVAVQVYDAEPAHVELTPAINLEDPFLFQIGRAALDARGSKGPSDTIFMESLAQMLAVHLFRHYVNSSVPPPAMRGRLPARTLRGVLECIAQSPEGDLSLKRLAKLANLSPYHFARLFQRTTGKTVHRYVTEQRLRQAYHLLMRSNLLLAEIAARVGFADQSHFVRQFKNLFGITPGALRKDRKIPPTSAQDSSI